MSDLKKNILILGSNGFLGQSLIKDCFDPSWHVVGRNRSEIDVTNKESLSYCLDSYYDFQRPIVFNCASCGGRKFDKSNVNDFFDNIKMFQNLLDLKNKCKKIWLFGSGAEFSIDRNDDYSIVKRRISEKVKEENKFILIRFWNLFGIRGLKNSFIHTAINNYLNKQPIEIWNDIYFDFFSFSDFSKIVLALVENPPEEFYELDCCYANKYKLSDIAKFINNLSNHKVPINIKCSYVDSYIGGFDDRITSFGIKSAGLFDEILRIYNYYFEKRDYNFDKFEKFLKFTDSGNKD